MLEFGDYSQVSGKLKKEKKNMPNSEHTDIHADRKTKY